MPLVNIYIKDKWVPLLVKSGNGSLNKGLQAFVNREVGSLFRQAEAAKGEEED